MQQLILIRGLPGSGKSTLAKEMVRGKLDWYHFEADMFHMKNGVYQFNPDNIKEAHKWCQDKTAEALKAGCSVVVSNTFTQKWEMGPYEQMAYQLDIAYRVMVCYSHYQNIHNVPVEVISKMAQRWED